MRRFLTLGLALAAVFSATHAPRPAAAAEAANAGAPAVLDEYSYWREFQMLLPPVVAAKAEGAAAPEGEPRTAPPPAGWTAVDFDDGRWARLTGPVLPGTGNDGYGAVSTMRCENIALICLRGRFSVDDPAKVTALKLSAVLRGGAVVYLNGVEVARSHLPKGELTPGMPAEEYPLAAYTAPDGRLRRLEGAALPVKELRKGVNVLSIELHRSPVNPDSASLKQTRGSVWAQVGLQQLRLTAEPEASVKPNTQRPKGTQVWNEDPMADVYDLDWGDPNEPLRPIELTGVRHGAFSGMVAVGSDAPIKGLSARASDLVPKGGGQPVPAAAVRLSYPLPDGVGGQDSRSYRGFSSRPRFDALAEAPPAEVPLATIKPPKGYSGPLPAPGAVQPVRITVDVPADAAAGDYEGTLSIKAEAMPEVSVPVKLTVYAWALPDPCDFTSVLGAVQSPDSLAVKYDVPVWSERHWGLIDRSFSLLARAGQDVVFVPLVMKNHHGREAMVRWVKNDDGTYSHDFSIFEKYLDTALKHIKRPELVTLYVWDRAYRVNPGRSQRIAGTADTYKAPPVVVPLLDRKTGEVTEMEGPTYNDPKAPEFWKPVLDGCHERLKQRGIADRNILLGVVPDGGPAPETIDMFHEAAPWAEWMNVSHAPGSRFKGAQGLEVKVAFSSGVYGGTRGIPDPAEQRYHAWQPYNKYSERFGVFPRDGAPYTYLLGTSGPSCWLFQESYLMTGLRGPMRIGGEFWQLTDKGGGKPWTFISKYSGSVPGVSQSVMYVLAPGPDGPLSTLRIERLYEGSQEGEARIFLEKTLEAGKAPDADAVQAMLDLRQRIIRAYQWGKRSDTVPWYEGSGWQARSQELYRAAATVQAAAAGK